MNRPRKRDKHLPACVFKRHGAYYYVKAGKWTRLGDTLPVALAEYARRQGTGSGSMGPLIMAALDARKSRLAKSTWESYQDIARRLSKIMAEFNPEDVMPRHIAQIRQGLSKTPGMANRALSVLRVTFAYAVEQQLVDSNPTLGIKRMEEHKRDRLISMEEYKRIYDAAGSRLRVVMDLCYLTGQRISDVLAIRLSDLLDTGIMFHQRKTGVRLTVAWTPDLRMAVKSAQTIHGNLRALTLLHNRRGGPLSYLTVYQDWNAACALSGVADAHLHDIRAMSGTAAEEQGLDPQKLLGHTSAANTKRYLRGKKIPVVNGPSIGQVLDYWTERAKKSTT